MARTAYILTLILCLLAGFSDVARGQSNRGAVGPRQSDEETRRELAPLRAGFIVNFASFTTWPNDAFENEQTPLVITVVNDRELARQVATMTVDKQIHKRRVLVYHMVHPSTRDSNYQTSLATLHEQLRRSHVVYLSLTLQQQQIDQALDSLENRPVLTISSKPQFAENGGMLGLVVRSKRLAIDANVDAIDDARLNVSSKVLKLARIVRSSRPRREGS